MKKLLAFMLFLCSVCVSAQDVIVKKDGTTEVCRVEKVSDSDVTYKKWDDLNGPSYIMDISLVASINYKNGVKKTFGEIVRTQGDPNDGKPSMSDAELQRLYEEINAGRILQIHNENQEKEIARMNIQKKVKRLKTWGWIGGVVAIGGIGLTVAAANSSDGFRSADALYAPGAVLFGVGAGTSIYCFIKAHKLKNEINALEYSSLYRYDIPLSNGSFLSVGADMLNDRIMNKRTVGLGLSYNF